MSDRDQIIEVMARAEASFEEIEYDRFPELFSEQAEHMLALLEKSGLAVVPVKPTEAMLAAGNREIFDLSSDAVGTWIAMLTASKEPER